MANLSTQVEIYCTNNSISFHDEVELGNIIVERDDKGTALVHWGVSGVASPSSSALSSLLTDAEVQESNRVVEESRISSYGSIQDQLSEMATDFSAWATRIVGVKNLNQKYEKVSGVKKIKDTAYIKADNKGSTGAKGSTGSAGAKGATGAKGDKGDIGATGPTGATGSAGAKGNKGDTGATGPQGATGANSTVAGPTGATGAQGATGSAGAKGDKGDTGAAGSNGTNGSAGAKGDKGDTGSTGPQGSIGATGSAGAKGNTGSAGSNGTNGSDGATGNSHLSGITSMAIDSKTGDLSIVVSGKTYIYAKKLK